MKKQLSKIATLTLALFSLAASSQEKIQPCNTYAAMEQAFASDPQAQKRFEAAEKQRQIERTNYKNLVGRPSAVVYTVPVVFHILYECNGQTISDSALIGALARINQDYARTSGDTAQIVNPFKTSYIPSDIHLMLAKKDPQGNCINGIVRHETSKTHWSQASANSLSTYWSYTWDPTTYLNVYIVAEIVPQGTVTGGGTIVGYTYIPGTWGTGSSRDAIVYDMDFISGSSNGVHKSRSLSHEMGHWFSLAHTFGNTNNPGVNCADDGIADTPITKGEFGGCASSLVNSCPQTNPAMNGLNNVQNIMNYSDCPRNFTTDQTGAMRAALSSATAGRSHVSSPAALAAADVNGTGLCPATAEFFTTNCGLTICKGGSLSLKDFSYNGSITGVTWSANNGAVVANPTSSVTSISFPNTGIVNVTLVATTAQGTGTKTKQITVIDNIPGFGPQQMESFENPGLPADWTITDVSNDGVTWTQTTSAAYDQSTSYMIPGFSDPSGQSDILQMPTIDVLNNQTNVLQFAYAYRQYNATYNDVLKIEGSKDCGGTWQTIFSLTGNYMQSKSGGIGTDDFVPAASEWSVYVISSHPNWQSYKSSSSVMVRFNYITGSQGYGNNMYIDAVSFTSTTSIDVGINELTKSVNLALYPNPTTGETNLSFKLQGSSTVKINVVDVMGRDVAPSVETTYNAGEQVLSINKGNTLSKGVYFVNLSINGAKMSKKLVIN